MQQLSILKSLRSLSPRRDCTFAEALGLAERQAAKLNQLLASTHPGYQLTGIARERDPEPEPTTARCARPIWTPRWQPQQFTIRRPEYGRR